MDLRNWIETVSALDEGAMAAARERQAQLAKPPGSLGRLEELSIQLAGITGKVHNSVVKQHLLVFAADNGVVEEGVSSAPQSVTLMQTINLTRAKTGASVLCRHFGCGITVCDVGVNADIRCDAVLNRKIAYGTQNIVKGPAMSREQAMQAIMTGIELARNTDADVIGIGEMGIGNTTTSSAVLAVLLDADVEAVTEPELEILPEYEALLEYNPDLVGWISSPGTRIDYPVVQRPESQVPPAPLISRT